jgi:Cu(I)/Ag(I) efflux system membrane fusion protein
LTSWELQQWQLAWLQAELSAQTQQSLVNAYRQLVAQGVPLPDPVLRNAELALQSARTLASSWKSRLSQLAGLSEAQLQALLQQHQLVSRVALTAPQEGWAVPAELAVGQFLTPDQALAEILPSSVPQIRARVPEPLWNAIRQASAGRFRPAWVGWPVWSARLFYLEEIQTADQQRFVWAQLQDAPENLPLNLRGSLTVDINGSQAAVLAVPATALWREGNQWAVFVYHRDRDTFEYRPVVVGKVNDQWAEIRTGLQPGEEVAVTCVPDLRRHYGRLRSATGIYSGHCED